MQKKLEMPCFSRTINIDETRLITNITGECVKCKELVCSRKVIVPPTLNKQAAILAIGEAPGQEEEVRQEGFVGIAGKTLDRLFVNYGVLRNDYSRANICRCRPPLNRKPTRGEVNNCLNLLAATIKAAAPKVILTVGLSATKVFCGNRGLYQLIMDRRETACYDAISYYDYIDPILKPVVPKSSYIVPMPHTSPLAFNRYAPNKKKWAEIALEQVALAVRLANS